MGNATNETDSAQILKSYVLASSNYAPFTKNSTKFELFTKNVDATGPPQLCCHRLEISEDDTTFEKFEYYSRRRMIAANENVLELLFVELRDSKNNIVVAKEIKERECHAKLTAICSSRSFIKQADSTKQLSLNLLNEFYENNLEQEIENRQKHGQEFKEEDLWSVICSAAVAIRHLISHGFKPPLLSPKAILFTSDGIAKYGEWEFILFGEKQIWEEKTDEGEIVFNEKLGWSKDSSRIMEDYLEHFYWAPEGLRTHQKLTQVGYLYSLSELEITSQIFSLGMTVLHMILLRPLYQAETYSERQIRLLLNEATEKRMLNQPLSESLLDFLHKSLEWNHRERITHVQLYDKMLIAFGTFSTMKNSLSPFSETADETIELSANINNKAGQAIQTTLSHSNSEKDKFATHYKNGVQFEFNEIETSLATTAIRIQPEEQNKFFNFMAKNHCSCILDKSDEDKGSENVQIIFPNIEIERPDDFKLGESKKDKTKKDPEGIISYRLPLQDSNRDESFQDFKLSPSVRSYQNSKSLSSVFALEKKSQAKIEKQLTNRSEQISAGTTENNALFTDPKLLDMIRNTYKEISEHSERLDGKEKKKEKSVNPHDQKKYESQNHLFNENIESNHNSETSIYVRENFSRGRYEGYKVRGKKNGFGVFSYHEGGKYCGNWINDKMTGKGTLYYSNGRIAYEGDWLDDCLHGKGVLFNENPTNSTEPFNYSDFGVCEDLNIWLSYSGVFENDNKSCNGKLTLTNGEYYEGEFSDDMVHGIGIFYSKSRGPFKGEWKYNKLVNVFSL